MRMAVSIAHAFDVVLIERVPRAAVRASAPTWSTPGSPCRNARKAASEAVTSVKGGSGAAVGRAGSDSAVGSRTCVMPSIFPCGGSAPDPCGSEGVGRRRSADDAVLLEDPGRAVRDQVEQTADVALARLGLGDRRRDGVAEAVQHREGLGTAGLCLAGDVAGRILGDRAADVATRLGGPRGQN